MIKKYDLAVMDWGIGGLSVYREITRLMPDLSVLYFSDAGRKPYGKMNRTELGARIRELILWFESKGIRHTVIACNAASTILPDIQAEMQERGLFVVGMIEQGLRLIEASRFRRVGVIGGKRTIRSRCFQVGAGRKKITGRTAQPLSAMIESGELNSLAMTSALQTILRPLQASEALLLACTHYPAVADQIQKILPECVLLDPAPATAIFVKRQWRLRGSGDRKPQRDFLTSGDRAQMKHTARAAFGIRIPRVLKVP